MVNNFFGDALGLMGSGTFTPYKSILGGYGAMPGSAEVNDNLQPQWRGHYLDETGFYYMGARYYEPKSGRFISADPLGHSASLSLYDYCGGDPVNGLDPDGRCVEGYSKGYEGGLWTEHENTTQQIAGLVGTFASYITSGYGPLALARDYNNAPEGYGKGVARNATFLGNWMMGTMPSTVVYDPNSPETMDMRNSTGVASIRKFFLNKKHGKTATALFYDTFAAAKDTLPNPHQWANTALEVGGFGGAKIINNGNGTATFMVPNTAGTQSFFYHAFPDRKSYTGPMHNVEQIFIWTEPIGPIPNSSSAQ